MKRRRKEKMHKRINVIFCALVYTFLFLPISVIVVNSMNATTSKPYLAWKGFTLDWYVQLLSNRTVLRPFLRLLGIQ